MLVENKRKSIVFVPTGGTPTKGLKLLPGVNDVDPALWEEAKKLKVIQHFIAEGELLDEVVAGKAATASITKIGALPEKAAIKVVRDTLDAELLKRWAAEEKREPVKKALADQLAKVQPPKKPEGGDKGGDQNPPKP